VSDRFQLVEAGDSAVIVELEDRIDARVNAKATRIADAAARARIPGVRDVVPTYRTVAVYFDPLRTDYAALTALLEREGGRDSRDEVEPSEPTMVPVCYGGASGPDLADVAKFAGMSEAEAIALHAGETYRVYMLGFVPGFAYMGTVDRRIAAPRHAVPRTRVPAGSVGIAGLQTGIYPVDTPGGWQLIGRTPLQMFDPERPRPSLFKAGDRVRFQPISPEELAAALSRRAR
jgi:inhibitor of KinA